MEENNVTLGQWRELYKAVIELKKLRPWEWMWDSEIFGVQDPESGEIGYCCVMGRAGEHYALAVYDGTEGLNGYWKVRSGEVGSRSADAMYCQKCLMVSFEDRDYLEQKDRKIIKRLELKFRGDNAWPMFRNWTPGYLPWFITPEEARYILHLIPQVIDVTGRFKEDLTLLIPPVPGQYLVRVPRLGPDGLIWEDEWKEPARLSEPMAISSDISTLEKIQETIPLSSNIWEIDYFYILKPVRENQERPYFPRMMLCADHGTGMILFFHMAEISSRGREEFIEEFIGKLENFEALPGKILVKENGFALLESIAVKLGIAIKKVPDLPVMNEVRVHMEQFG